MHSTGDTDDGIVTRSVMYLFDQMQKATSGCKYTFRSESTQQPHLGKHSVNTSAAMTQHDAFPVVLEYSRKGHAWQPTSGLLFHPDWCSCSHHVLEKYIGKLYGLLHLNRVSLCFLVLHSVQLPPRLVLLCSMWDSSIDQGAYCRILCNLHWCLLLHSVRSPLRFCCCILYNFL